MATINECARVIFVIYTKPVYVTGSEFLQVKDGYNLSTCTILFRPCLKNKSSFLSDMQVHW